MIAAPWSPAYTKAWGTSQDAQGYELKRQRLWNVSDTITNSLGTGTGSGNVPDGVLAFRTTTSQRRLNFTDTGADVIVPRVDYNESVSGQWGFIYNSGAPFTVTSSTKVTNLNADLLDGYDTAESETASTVAVRNSSGRLKCADPVSGTDVVNYQSMTAYVSGAITPKVACKYATTAALPSFTASGTPKVLTATANGALTVDGNSPTVGQRIGVVYETSTNEKYNGIYTVTATGDGSNPWVLTRATDSDTSAEMPSGTQFWVTSGTDNGGSSWLLVTPDPITLDTTALAFVQNGGIANIIAGNGIDKTGNTLSVKINASTTYTQGAIVYADSTTTLNAAQLTGIIKGNGSSAPTAVTGTNNVITKWGTSGTTLTTSTITDDGTSVSVAANLNPSADSLRNFGTTSLAWLSIVGDVLTSTAGTGVSFTQHTTMYSTHTCWSWGLKGAESGSNAGSNLVLTSYTDAGTASTEVITITRSTGAISFSNTISATGATFSGLTSGKHVKASSGGQLADSLISESGSNIYINGDVGVGTSSPGAKLDIVGTSGLLATFGSDAAVGDSVYVGYGGLRAFVGYNGTTTNAVIQATSGKGIEFNVNNNTFGSGTGALLTSAGMLGIGTSSTVSARIHSISTTEQLRLGFNATYFASFTVTSAGALVTTTIAGMSFVTGANGNIAFTPNGTGDVTSSGRVHITKNTEQFRVGYDSSNYHSFTESSSAGLAIRPVTAVKTASSIGTTIYTDCTSSTASVELVALNTYSVGVNSQGTNIGVLGEAAFGLLNVGGRFNAGSGSGTIATGVLGYATKSSAGSETSVRAVNGTVNFTSSASSTTGVCFYATAECGTTFTSLVGFQFSPSYSGSPTGTTVYGAKFDSAISGATIATNYALYLNATGGTANYALWVAAGTIRLDSLTASTMLKLDASKNLVSTTDLPAATTIDGKVIARKATGSITWSLSGSEYICDITHGLGTDAVTVEVYDGSANKSTWMFENRRPSSGVVRIVADSNFGSGYTYVIIG